MTKTQKILYGALLAVIAVLLVIGGIYDLTIANNVYQPDNIVARVLEGAGIFPPFVFVGATFAVLFFLIKPEDEKRTLKKVICLGCSALSYLVFGYMAADALEPLWQKAIVALCGAALLTPLTYLFFKNKKETSLKRFEIFLIFASIVCVISSLFTVNVVKYLWGRVRYREMVAENDVFFEAFTAWYRPNGFSLHGHHSFPSGHTCSATNLLVLLALDEVFPDSKKYKKTLAFLVFFYIFIMAYSRLVLGAHFLSDVTGGFAIGLVTYAVARYLYFDKSRVVVDAILAVNEGETAADGAEPAQEDAGKEETQVEFEQSLLLDEEREGSQEVSKEENNAE